MCNHLWKVLHIFLDIDMICIAADKRALFSNPRWSLTRSCKTFLTQGLSQNWTKIRIILALKQKTLLTLSWKHLVRRFKMAFQVIWWHPFYNTIDVDVSYMTITPVCVIGVAWTLVWACSGIHFTKCIWACNWKLMKIFVCLWFLYWNAMMSQFCTS